MAEQIQKRLITMKQLSEMISVPIRRLRYWREKGVGPEVIKLEGTILYDLATVNQYIEDNRETNSVRAHVKDEVKRHVTL